jgi:hypothetical protein
MPHPRRYDRRLVQLFHLHQKHPIKGFDVWGVLPPPKSRMKIWRRRKANNKNRVDPSPADDVDSDSSTAGHVPNGDLVCFVPRQEDDVFSRWIAERVSKYFSCCMPTDEEVGIAGFKYGGILRQTVRITTIIASVLPCISIVVLYSLKSTWIRLVALFGFNALIAICVTIMTNAKPLDVFAISAA